MSFARKLAIFRAVFEYQIRVDRSYWRCYKVFWWRYPRFVCEWWWVNTWPQLAHRPRPYFWPDNSEINRISQSLRDISSILQARIQRISDATSLDAGRPRVWVADLPRYLCRAWRCRRCLGLGQLLPRQKSILAFFKSYWREFWLGLLRWLLFGPWAWGAHHVLHDFDMLQKRGLRFLRWLRRWNS